MDPRYAMIEEIREQPGLLQSIFERRAELTAPFVALMKKHPVRKVWFIGNGSPYYAGCTLRYAAEHMLHAEAEAVPAALFHHHGDFNVSGIYAPEDILLVCPAESGHSRGQVDAARRAQSMGIRVMSTTLNPTGVLARSSDVVLPKPGEHEIAMAATKGQSMALYLILLCFIEGGRALGHLSEEEYRRYMTAMANVPENVRQTIRDTEDWFEKNEQRVMKARTFFLLGYGANYGTVQEAALKFFECHQVPTWALELEESLHGPYRGLGKEDMAFYLAAEAGPERDRMELLAGAARQFCRNQVLIQSCHRGGEGDILPIHSGDVPYVNAIEYLIPLQTLSYLIAERMGIDLSIPLVSALDPVMIPGYED
ncbi:MAG: hypothetical protein IJD21_02355 [Oscillospiraceae bacterium]|nr:hypothetical protein [Oscillospiraceae bacterium]